MQDLEKLKEQKISSKEVFKGGLLHVFSDKVELPDGTRTTREWIKHPGASAVVPFFKNDDVMLIKQFRYPLRNVFYEIPAGKIDKNETPDLTATRELKEEAGLAAQNLHYLGPYYPSIGYTDEIIHLYVAWNIEETTRQVDDDEFLITERLPFSKAVEMAYDGKIGDGKTIAGLLRTQHWQQNAELE